MSRTLSGVELWFIDAARSGPALAAIEAATPRLSDDERSRAAGLRLGGEDWRLFRIALRMLLERFVGPRLRCAPFQRGPRGKPALPWPAGVAFSLSHSGRYSLIAIAPHEVGIDLERERQVRFSPDRQQAMLTAARALTASPDESTAALGMLQAWVRLEAWSKARGSGIGALLHDLEIRGPGWHTHGANADFAAIAADLQHGERFRLYDLALSNGFYGALAAHDHPASLTPRQLPADRSALEGLMSV